MHGSKFNKGGDLARDSANADLIAKSLGDDYKIEKWHKH
jgi:hypothetical protein